MGVTIKIILTLVVLAFLALVGFSYAPGSLVPDRAAVSRPVVLNVE